MAAVAAAVGVTLVGASAAVATHGDVSLSGSNFEIDTNANLKVDHAEPPSLDWNNVAQVLQNDKISGAGDDSFGQGTKEDTAVPTIVSGRSRRTRAT